MGKIIIAIIVIVAVAVGAFLIGKGGLGFGGGKGDGEGDGDITTVELRVNGNEYIYNNDKYSLDEVQALVDKIKELDDISVKLVDDNASEKAFQAIEQALKDTNIRIVKE